MIVANSDFVWAVSDKILHAWQYTTTRHNSFTISVPTSIQMPSEYRKLARQRSRQIGQSRITPAKPPRTLIGSSRTLSQKNLEPT